VHGEALVEGHPFAALSAYPQGETAPEVWMLGSSLYGAQLAAVLGLPYCFAWFITDGFGCDEAFAQYRKNYRPSERWPEPHVAICLWALAADAHDEAQHHFTSRARWKLYRDRGIYGPLESPEDAAAHEYTDKETEIIAELRRDSFVGTGAEVAGRMKATAAELDAVEIAVVTWAHDEAARRRSYELLAAEFGL
jgi:luciferase family oxidoreductase group 1